MRRSFSLFAALLVAAVPALAEEFRPGLRPGMSWTFEYEAKVNLTTQATANGAPQPPQTMVVTSFFGGLAEVLEAKEGIPTVLKLTIEAKSGYSQGAALQPFSVSGKTVTLKRQPDNSIAHDFQGQLNEDELYSLLNMLASETYWLPKQPASAGQSWEVNAGLIARIYGLSEAQNPVARCTLRSCNADIAEVEIATDMQQQSPNGPMTLRLQGKGIIDRPMGRMAVVQMEGQFNLQLQGQQQDPFGNVVNIAGTVSGPATFRMASQPRGAGGPPPVNPPALPPSNPPVFPPVNPPANPPPGNPLAATDPIPGTYKSDALTIEIRKAADGYEGTIRMGANAFPMKARAEGGKLSGTFESQGSAYPFSATVEGNRMTFVTEGTTYNLTK